MAKTEAPIPSSIHIYDGTQIALEIENVKELKQWLEQQIQWLNYLNTNINGNPPAFVRKISIPIRDHIPGLERLLQTVQTNENIDEWLNGLSTDIAGITKSYNFCLYFNDDAHKLNEFIENEDMGAAWVLAAEIFNSGYQLTHISNMNHFFQAQRRAHHPATNFRSELKTHKSALTRLKSKWDTSFQSQKSELSKHITIGSNQLEAFNNKSSAALHNFKTESDQAKKSATDNIDNVKNDLTNLTNTYSEHMKLRAAESLWGTKKRQHRFAKTASLWAFIIWIIASATGLFFYFRFIFEYISKDASLTLKTMPWSMQFILFIVPLILSGWILKIILSNYRKNQSQQDDAAERQTMVMTFKALEYDDSRASDDERLVILNALFRQHNSQTDDGVPSPAWEAILKKLDK